MKKHQKEIFTTTVLLLACLLMIFVLAPLARAAEIEVAFSPGITAYKMEAIKPAHSYRLTIMQNGFYTSAEQENFNIYGQDMAITSLSLGYRHQFKSAPVFIYGQGGYYRPDYASRDFGREAAYQEMARQYGYHGLNDMPWMDRYEVNFKGNFGAEVGLGVQHKICNGISLNLSLGYRYLRMWGDYDGYRTVGGIEELGWIMSRSDNFDAMKIYGGVGYEF